jgi:ABC-type lipoprotein export system ATPase subunit
MIEIKNITKTYKSKKGFVCHALKNITFNLPDTGMVFVVGKSGCGKTTLLNLIGGLDNITSGTIISAGNDLSKFTNDEFDAYRNSYFGFVFQNYYLIDDLTVFENIKLALDIQNETNDEKVYEIIKEVDLEGFEHRYPIELSGGQKQRVAIARALIKKPQLILADEPTGNLDSKTSVQILNLLQKLSKDYLVLIVSHNVDDAKIYADRIIELSDGEIVRDVSKEENYKNELTFENGILSLPHKNKMSNEELKLIKEYIENNNVNEIVQKSDGFSGTGQITSIMEKVKLVSPSMKRKNKFALSKKLFKEERGSSIFTSIIVSLFLVILGLCQTMVNFNRQDVIDYSMNPKDFIVRKVAYEDKMGLVELEIDASRQEILKDDEVNAFLDNGYTGKYYYLYGYSHGFSNYKAIEYQHYLTAYKFTSNFYSETDYGTLVCDYEFLLEKFGNENNELEYIGDLYDNPQGIIITDYMADSIMFYSGKISDYQSLLGQNDYSYINAIIMTDYKSRHKTGVETFVNMVKNGATKEEQTEFFTSKEYANLVDEIEQYLAINYSLNSDFINVVKASPNDANFSIRNTRFITDSGIQSEQINYLSFENNSTIAKDLVDGEMIMGYTQYNSYFGTHYTQNDLDTFVPHKVVMSCYNGENAYYTKEFTIVKLRAYSGVYVSYDEYNDYLKASVFKTAIYFDDPSLTDKLYDVAIDNAFRPVSIYYDSIYEINKGLSVVKTLFIFISIVLVIACVLFLISYSVTSVRKKKIDIGILRGLGMSNFDMYILYIVQFIKIGILISIILSLGLLVSSSFANTLLQEGFSSLMNLTFIKGIQIIHFDFEVLLIDIGLLFAILIISLIFPILKLRKIKPLNIIKSK